MDTFSQASRRAFEHLDKIQSDRGAAPGQLSELLALDCRWREKALLSTPRFHSYSLATHALEKSKQEISRDPATAWELVRLARMVIGHLDPRDCGGYESLTDFAAYALAMEGNIHRVRGDVRAALAAFSRVRTLQLRGGVDPDLGAAVDLMESSLRRDFGQLNRALFLLDRASEVFLLLEERERVAQTMINRANIYNVKGDWTTAVEILRVALEWPLDERLTLSVRHNLTDALVKAGRTTEAAQVFSATHSLYDRFSDNAINSHRLWVEGLITRELGDDLQRASKLLEMATEGFKVHGYAGDAGLAQLDLIATRRKLALSRRRRSARERFADPFHPGVAAAQQDTHPATVEPICAAGIGEDAGQGGGSSRLDDDLQVACDQS